ncbi:MAG: hypothetical protein K2Y05_03760 [Hyphomicrobiaceae bacterium]|nr:hypothetical protein [Hyphomicrobiaceae bacterium]
MAALAAVAAIDTVDQQAIDREDRAAANGGVGQPPVSKPFATTSAETLVAAYVGVPYTYPSDVRFTSPAKGDDLVLRRVGWDGKPFQHPLYYGARIARWAPGNRSGVMIDFLHSKAISRPADTVKLEGTLDGKPAPKDARIDSLFRTFEFSHGHNMLMATGLFRFAALTPRIAPYAGIGGGVSLPHTEVKWHSEDKRTYEYQYVGPVGQALVGLEFRLGGSSVFLEYKFTLADYRAPLTRRDGDLLVTDVWRQMGEWWSGIAPPGGHVATRLTSHNFVVGAGPRFSSP